MQVILVGR